MLDSFSKVYAEYYDVLYKEKEYANECVQLNALIKQYCPSAHTLLNLGCGTGNHDGYLAEFGYEITGLDLSENMLALAKKKIQKTPEKKVTYRCADIRTFQPEQKYDVVLSLFHVTSYLVSDQDLVSAFNNIYASLNPGGIFVFDFWYTTGILENLPERRSKKIETQDSILERISEPTMRSASDQVEVLFTLKIQSPDSEERIVVEEKHLVRHFEPEMLAHLLRETGFEITAIGADYTLKEFDRFDRYATMVVRK